jgi:hypothetical protein
MHLQHVDWNFLFDYSCLLKYYLQSHELQKKEHTIQSKDLIGPQ